MCRNVPSHLITSTHRVIAAQTDNNSPSHLTTPFNDSPTPFKSNRKPPSSQHSRPHHHRRGPRPLQSPNRRLRKIRPPPPSRRRRHQPGHYHRLPKLHMGPSQDRWNSIIRLSSFHERYG